MNITLETEDGPWALFQIYAPDLRYSDVEMDLFYESFQNKLNVIAPAPPKKKIIVLGNINANIDWNAFANWQDVCGRFSIGFINESEEKLLQFCTKNKLCLTNTLCKHEHRNLVRCTSPDGRAQNQTDLIIIQHSCKSTVKNSTDIGSVYSLLLM